jgi:hypothetical protein
VDVPPVRGPLLHQVVAGVLRIDHAADQRVVDAGVVVRNHHPQPLADLERQRLRLQLLGVPLGHGEFALEGDHLRPAEAGADDVPERRLARRGGHADARRAAVDVVGDVDALRVAGERLDAARFRLREQRVVGEPMVLQQRLHRAGAAAETERVDRKNRHLGVGVVAPIAGRAELPFQRLTHDHPQRITGRDAVPAGQHELVAVGMLGTPVVEPQSAPLRPGQVRRHVVGRVGERPTEVPGLRVVTEQHQGHAGHEADVFQPFEIGGTLIGGERGVGSGRQDGNLR